MKKYSFFSYKGGSGRTSLLYNTIPFLAEELGATEKEPIIVVDFDVDSKGLSYLLNPDKSFHAKYNSIQVLRHDQSIDWESEEEDVTKHPFFRELQKVGEEMGLSSEKEGAILFITADTSSEKDASISADYKNYDMKNITDLKHLVNLCKDCHCKALVMDLPTGGQLSGDYALRSSDKVVTVTKITDQFCKGTYEFLEGINNVLDDTEFVIVPNVIPDATGTVFDIEGILNRIGTKVNAILTKNKCNTVMFSDGRRGINEVRLFKFKETNLVNKEKQEGLLDDEKEAMESYKFLAKELAI